MEGREREGGRKIRMSQCVVNQQLSVPGLSANKVANQEVPKNLFILY